jgi:hypothetical protein
LLRERHASAGAEAGALQGAVLIGALPYAWLEYDLKPESYVRWPSDLFLMDLDGEWLDVESGITKREAADPAGPRRGAHSNGFYELHLAGAGDLAPEIFVGRIDPARSNPWASRRDLLICYLDKNHRYWTGEIHPGNKVLYSEGGAWCKPGGKAVVARTDRDLKFNWGKASPAQGIAPDGFSVRWTGRLLPRKTGLHEILVRCDDGCRVVIGGRTVIDEWTPSAEGVRSGRMSLRQEEQQEIEVEYYDQSGDARIEMSWKPPGMEEQPIPPGCLLATDGKPGLLGHYFNGLLLDVADHSVTSLLSMARPPGLVCRYGRDLRSGTLAGQFLEDLADPAYRLAMYRGHGWDGGLAFEGGGARSEDIARIAPKCLIFYSDSCSPNCWYGQDGETGKSTVGQAFVFGDRGRGNTLALVGCNKVTGGELGHRYFVRALGSGKCAGAAFVEQASSQMVRPDGVADSRYQDGTMWWFYGYGIIGDPFVCVPRVDSSVPENRQGSRAF